MDIKSIRLSQSAQFRNLWSAFRYLATQASWTLTCTTGRQSRSSLLVAALFRRVQYSYVSLGPKPDLTVSLTPGDKWWIIASANLCQVFGWSLVPTLSVAPGGD